MKTNTPERKSSAPKHFYDFTLFSEVVVLPGTVLTPRQPVGRSRVTPLRRRTTRSRLSAWARLPVAYIQGSVNVPMIRTKTGEVPAETEEEQWGASARRARRSWMDENAY